MRKKEEETKAAQFQAVLTQHQSFLQAMTQRRARQLQQNQHMQMLMAQQSQAMMSVLEKLLLREWLKSHRPVLFQSSFTEQEVLD